MNIVLHSVYGRGLLKVFASCQLFRTLHIHRFAFQAYQRISQMKRDALPNCALDAICCTSFDTLCMLLYLFVALYPPIRSRRAVYRHCSQL